MGGKASNWEGGVRVAAFVSGGLVPAAMRGAKLDGYVHISDWFSTFCGLAGVDPTDTSAAAHGLPPIDSLDLWPMISGANRTSPRTEMALMVDVQKRDRKGVFLLRACAVDEGGEPLTLVLTQQGGMQLTLQAASADELLEWKLALAEESIRAAHAQLRRKEGELQHVGQLLMEIHYWGSACLRKIDEWFDDARSQELCKRWGVQKPGGSHKLKMKACFLGMCIEHPPTADELSSMSAAMHGLRQQGLSFYSIVPNTEHSTASTRIIGRSENGSVAAALDESTGGLCCYEVGLSRSTL